MTTINDITGKVFWRRSGSGRTMSLWLCVRLVGRDEWRDKTYQRWLCREIIRGGVGPMHGKSLRKCWSAQFDPNWPNWLDESEYTDEINALVAEGMAFERATDHIPGGSSWYERENAIRKRYEPRIRSIYQLFGRRYSGNSHNQRKHCKYEVQTSSGYGLRLYAEFEDELKARDFVKTLFAYRLAQQATITDKFDNSVQKFRRKKHKDY